MNVFGWGFIINKLIGIIMISIFCDINRLVLIIFRHPQPQSCHPEERGISARNSVSKIANSLSVYFHNLVNQETSL